MRTKKMVKKIIKTKKDIELEKITEFLLDMS